MTGKRPVRQRINQFLRTNYQRRAISLTLFLCQFLLSRRMVTFEVVNFATCYEYDYLRLATR